MESHCLHQCLQRYPLPLSLRRWPLQILDLIHSYFCWSFAPAELLWSQWRKAKFRDINETRSSKPSPYIFSECYPKPSVVFWESLHFCSNSIIHVWQNLLLHYCALKTGNSSKVQYRKNETGYCPWREHCKAAASVLSCRLIGFCPIVSVHGCWMYSKTSQLLAILQTFLLDL